MAAPTPIRLLAAVGAIAATAAMAAQARAWSPDAATLARGQAWAEVLPSGDGAALIHAAVDIPAPPRTVWAVMTDCAMTRRLVANAVSCRVLSGDIRGGWDVREQVTRGGWLLPDIHNVYRSDYQPFGLIRFRKAGGNLKVEDGEWRLTPLNGGAGTRVTYVNRLAANILAPAGLVRGAMLRDTPKVLMNLRREAISAART